MTRISPQNKIPFLCPLPFLKLIDAIKTINNTISNVNKKWYTKILWIVLNKYYKRMKRNFELTKKNQSNFFQLKKLVLIYLEICLIISHKLFHKVWTWDVREGSISCYFKIAKNLIFQGYGRKGTVSNYCLRS